MIGKQILHYTIEEKLGQGGMGEVYLAQDTELERKVVLKFLSSHLTVDSELRDRFRNEARAAAALNHPNIVTVHQVGEHEGHIYIAMEHVEGRSLQDIIEEGALPVERAVEIAAQICDGLGAAHRAGIIHRDIKPANIIVEPSGRVRILDFGLARFTGATKLTKKSSTLGTISYMSPEQFQGGKVDERSDIWSVGVIIYEMLAGIQPFQGEYEQAIMYAVCHEEPEPLGSRVDGVPPGLEALVDHALEKMPENRFQHIEEMLESLRRIRDTEAGDTAEPVSDTAMKGLRSSLIGSRAVLFTVAALLLAAAYVIVFHTGVSSPEQAWQIRPLTSSVYYEGSPSWSPDGSMIAFMRSIGNTDIFIMSVEGGRPIQQTNHPADDLKPRWSPDGTRIAFISDRGTGASVYTMPASGGMERKLADTGLLYLERFTFVLESLGGQPWSPDGRYILFPRLQPSGETAIWRIDTETGEQQQITEPPAGSNDLAASWSFDGTSIVFQRNSGGKGSIWSIPADGGESKPILNDEFIYRNPVFSVDDRRIIFVSNRAGYENLWDIELGTGAMRQLTTGNERAYEPVVSRDGRLAYGDFSHQVDLYRLDIVQNVDERLTFHKADNFNAHLSPDGNKVVYQSNRTGDYEIWIRNLDTGEEINLTDRSSSEIMPAWSPDGDRVVFLSNRHGAFTLWSVDADGSNLGVLSEEPINLPANIFAYSLKIRWSPDGKTIGFIGHGDGGRGLLAVDPDGGNRRMLLSGVHSFGWWRSSRYVVYNSAEKRELRIADLQTGRETVLYTGPLTEISVAPDGRSLAYCHGVGHFNQEVYRLTLEPPESPGDLPSAAGEPEKLTRSGETWHVHQPTFAPDGSFIIYSRDEDEGELYVIENYR